MYPKQCSKENNSRKVQLFGLFFGFPRILEMQKNHGNFHPFFAILGIS